MFRWLFLLFWLISPVVLCAQTIILTLPSYADGRHRFYHELLQRSLKEIGVTLQIETSWPDVPQKRVVRLLDESKFSLYWFLQTPERDERFLPVPVDLTNGLISTRILLIPKGEQATYSDVDTLEQFRALEKVGGFGIDWFDVAVWEANQLPLFIKDGDWQPLFSMVSADRGVNYFSRGVTEILPEAAANPHLQIEQHLVFKYNRDFRFYFSRHQSVHYELVTEALRLAQSSGLIDRLVEKYWHNDLQALQLDKRVLILLQTP